MIKALVNEGEVEGKVEGSQSQVITECCCLTNSLLTQIALHSDLKKEEVYLLYLQGMKYFIEGE